MPNSFRRNPFSKGGRNNQGGLRLREEAVRDDGITAIRQYLEAGYDEVYM